MFEKNTFMKSMTDAITHRSLYWRPGPCMWLLLRLSPTRWNVKHTLLRTLGDSHVWRRDGDVQPWRLTPHTLLHNSTHPFFIPLPRIPFFKCVSSWMAMGGGHRGHGGIRCHFKKQLSGLTENGAWLCSLVKTASPHSALPAAQEVCLMESIKWPVLWDWLVLPVVPNEYFHRFFLLLLDASCRWIKIASYVSHR